MKRATAKQMADLRAHWQFEYEHSLYLWKGAAYTILHYLTHYRGQRLMNMLERQARLCAKMAISSSFWGAYNQLRTVHGLRIRLFPKGLR